jgi:hypothetical protein
MEMPAFEHLLLTRFNVPFTWTSVKPDHNWLRKRIVLFEKFCFPSVLRQTSQNFKWLVFFDKNSPDFLLDKIKEYQKYENFVPVFTPEFSARACRDLTREHLTQNTEYVITTHLDNDDAVALAFMQNVQDRFIPQDMTVLNFLYGYRYYKNKLYLQRYASNSFISLIESTQKQFLTTVYSATPHGQYKKIANMIDIRSEPSWLIVIHEDNIGNRRTGIRTPVSRLAKNFPHLADVVPAGENKITCFLERAADLPYYKLLYGWKNLKEKLKKILG